MRNHSVLVYRNTVVWFAESKSSSEKETPEEPKSIEQPASTEQETKAVATEEEPSRDVPLDVPSPILLGTSMILAIVSTGA
jgi:hypothetical protein